MGLSQRWSIGTAVAYNSFMTADNFQQLLDALAKRTPFRSFTVELVGGRRFEVDHARALVARDGVAVFILPGGIPVWFDHEGVVAIVGDTAQSSA
jgi:hypothetical protein